MTVPGPIDYRADFSSLSGTEMKGGSKSNESARASVINVVIVDE
jgi:hypothetical protein